MVNLIGAHAANNAKGGFLTSRVSVGGEQQGQSLTPTQQWQVTTAATPEYSQLNTVQTSVAYLAGGAFDIVDSTAALFGAERGAMNSGFWNGVGLPGMATFVEQNHSGVEVVSGLLGAVTVGVAAEMVAARVVTSGMFAATGLGRAVSPYVNMVSRAQDAAKAATLAAAKSGEVLRWTAPANLALVRNVALQNVGKAAVSEIAIAATLNKNSFIWSDDTQTNVVMAGLGLAIPGAAGLVFGRGEVYRWANSPEMRAAVSEAADPSSLLRGAQTTADFSRASAKPSTVLPVNPSYELTQYATDARVDDVSQAAKNNGQVSLQRSAIKTEAMNRVAELAQQISKRGVDLAPESRFGIKDMKGKFTPAGKHVMEALHEDPTALLGVRSLGVGDAEELIKARKDGVTAIKNLKANYTTEQIELIKRVETETPMVMVGKRWLTVEEGLPFARYKPITVIQKTIAGVQELAFKSNNTGRQIRIREDGRVAGAKIETLEITDVLGVRDAQVEQMNQMRRKGTPMTVPDKATYHDLDYAIEFEARGGKVNWTKSGVKDLKEAKLESLRKKAEMLKGKPTLTADDRIRFNLPLMTAAERMADPDSAALRQIVEASKKALTIDEVETLRKELYNRFDLTRDVEFSGRLDGDIYNFGFDRDGKYMQPVTGFFGEPTAVKWTKWDVQQAGVEGKTVRLQQMMQTKSKFIKDIVPTILRFPGIQQISDVTHLAANQMGGIAGTAGSIGASFLTQAQRFRHNPTLLAAQEYRRGLNHAIQQKVDAALAVLSRDIEQITSPAAARSKIMYDTYMSTVVGWDIKAPKMMGDGTVGFQLVDDSAQNMRRAGREIAKGELLMNPRTGKPVVLDEMGNALRIKWEATAKELLEAQNAVRVARGLEPIKHRKFFSMPKSTRGKIVGFTLGPDNKAVEGGAIVASTEAEFKRLATKLRAEFKPGDGKRFMRQDEISRFADLWDQADMDFVDPTSMAGPGGVQKGTLASDFIDATSIQRMLSFVKEGYENLGNGITRTVFTEQLKLAESLARAKAVTHGVPKGAKDIHEIYLETMLGMPSRMNPTGIVKVLNQVDESIDGFLEQWQGGRAQKDMAMYSREHLQSMMDKVGFPADKVFGKGRTPTFAQLADSMGDYMPFKAADEYAEYTLGLETPWKSRDMARKVNQFGTAAILRWGEFMHAAMNMAGIITNMPGILGQRNVPTIGRINNVGVVDSTMIMARGFKRMLSEGDHRRLGQKLSTDYGMMVRNGDASQQAAEFDIAFGQLKPGNHSRWNKFMFGDPSAPKGSLASKGIDGAISFVTDGSESASRRWAHFVGLELADHMKIQGLEARHTFARQIADQAIANYDPWNRPEIYQNALGSMYGLFLSYAQGYYQRIWSWMEAGEYKAIGRTLAMQSAMFGFGGMPGFRQLSSLIGGEEDGEGVMDGIYQRFGPAVGSIVAQGGFNQLTTLLGLPAIALHTRGDVNLRHPSLDLAGTGQIALPVGLEVLKDTVTAGMEGFGALFGPGGGRQAAEAFAYYMPSRTLSGVTSVLGAGGDEVDGYGNLISNTKGWGETAFRLMGVRSARQQGAIEAYYLNQRAQEIDSQRMSGVRAETRALIRAKNFEALPDVFQRYVDAGGKPWNYQTWIRGLITEAASTRSQNQLMQSMRNPGQQDLARRIQLMTEAYE